LQEQRLPRVETSGLDYFVDLRGRFVFDFPLKTTMRDQGKPAEAFPCPIEISRTEGSMQMGKPPKATPRLHRVRKRERELA
jgi:hypothetical protein